MWRKKKNWKSTRENKNALEESEKAEKYGREKQILPVQIMKKGQKTVFTFSHHFFFAVKKKTTYLYVCLLIFTMFAHEVIGFKIITFLRNLWYWKFQ